LDSVIAECNRVFDLISEKLQVQEKRKKYEDVVVLSSDLKDRATNLAKFGDNILTIPKPKPKEEKKTEKKETKDTPKDETKTENNEEIIDENEQKIDEENKDQIDEENKDQIDEEITDQTTQTNDQMDVEDKS